LAAAGCSPIVVVVPEERITDAREIAAPFDDVVVAAGGETRRSSVASGLEEVASGTVVIHDGARPFATPDLVMRVLRGLDGFDGAVAAIPVAETLKRADGQAVAETVDRADLWQVQTPQAFKTSVLRSAHERAARDGIDATDDAALVERYGGRIRIVEGSRRNMKLTYPEDFELAELIAGAG